MESRDIQNIEIGDETQQKNKKAKLSLSIDPKSNTGAFEPLPNEMIEAIGQCLPSQGLLQWQGTCLFFYNHTPLKRIIEKRKKQWKIFSTETRLYLLRGDGRVLGLGYNEFGQLGVGHQNPQITLAPICLPAPINDIEMDEQHTFFFSETDTVFACGKNEKQALGLKVESHPKQYICKPELVYFPEGKSIQRIFLIADQVIFLTKTGDVYMDSRQSLIFPQPSLTNNIKIADIFPTYKGILFLTPTGTVFYKINFPYEKNLVCLSECIKKILSKHNKNFLFNSERIVYAHGWNGFGQLGIGSLETYKDIKPVIFPQGKSIANIFILPYCTFFSTTDNTEVYACGLNYHGELGIGTNVMCSTPTRVVFPDPVQIKDIFILNEDENSTFFLTISGKLYAAGRNNDGQLGVGDQWHRVTPTQVLLPENKPLSKVFMMRKNVIFLTQEGECFMIQRDQFFQLNNTQTMSYPSYITFITLPDKKKINNLTVTSFYVLFTTTEGQYYGSEWNGDDTLKTPRALDLNTFIPQKKDVEPLSITKKM